MRFRIVLPSLVVMILLVSGSILIMNMKDAKPENRVIDTDTTFSIAVFPDTQIYPMYYPDTFTNMTEWVVEHKDEYNIKFVLHEGDITNNNNHPQWYNASKAMYVLNGSVPYTLNPGNHDLGPNGNAANRDTYLNDYFPSGPIRDWTSWGDAFEAGHQENTYHFFSGGGRDWLVMALEMAPRDAVLEWANRVVETHPDHLVLIVTHNYMVANQRMITLGGNYGIGNSPDGAATGEDIWHNFAKQHRNIMCVFSGHILQEWGWLVSNGVHGNPVYQMMVNFQMSGGGGQGFFRLLTFNMETETVNVETYSSLLDEIKTVPEHQFSFDLDIFNYLNDEPLVKNPIIEFEMNEDQEAGYIDLDGNQRPDTGIFYDPNIDQGDELDYYIYNVDRYQWVSLGNPLKLEEADIFYMPNGTFKVQFPENWHGSLPLQIKARDSRGASVGTFMNVLVGSVNDPPIIRYPRYWNFEEPIPEIKGEIITCKEDEYLNFTILAEDLIEPADVLTYTMDSESQHLFSLDSNSGSFSFHPTNDDVGDHLVIFNVTDGIDIVSRQVMIRVQNVNDEPIILTTSIPNAKEDEDYWFVLEAEDIDPVGDALSWSISTDSEFIDIDRRTGNITARPGQEEVGTHYMIVQVDDGNGGTDHIELTLEVLNTNDPPYIYNPPSILFMNEDDINYFSLEGWFDDIDPYDVLSFTTETDDPISIEVNSTNILTIAPAANWSGAASINITASDGNRSISDILKIVVENINDAPHSANVELEFTEVTEGDIMMATASADDVDLENGDELNYVWYSNITGNIGGGDTIDLALPSGHHLVTLTVSDKAGEIIHYNFEVIVKPLPVNDTIVDDEDDDNSEKRGPTTGIIIIAIVLPIIILIVVLAISIMIFIKKKRDETSEETNPNGDNPPVDQHG